LPIWESAYPFPLQDLDYLQECMQTNVCFFGLEMKGQIAALASSEMDEAAGHVEMTDFITLPGFRGQGLATLILQAMEQEMRMRGFWTAFSIARAGSSGINSVFARQGYAYRGRLVQNTNFNGMLEDMNVWSKRL
ncbi:MAG: GNAT family N-acetyltransferase, partial [Desulfovermiculus sp.]|nr:GNAT family N-acetyltransferase [Desulfovermiculus sp.]